MQSFKNLYIGMIIKYFYFKMLLCFILTIGFIEVETFLYSLEKIIMINF